MLLISITRFDLESYHTKMFVNRTVKLLLVFSFLDIVSAITSDECSLISDQTSDLSLTKLSRLVIPDLNGKRKGDAGKIGVIGGSVEYAGAPYFSAISALKVGADIVYVITTESAAPVIKTYSPELIVYPFLNKKSASKIAALLPKMDAIVIGPGIGREPDIMELIYEIIETSRKLQKPLIIDADGLYAVSKNVTVLKDYPTPGVILTPNHKETDLLNLAVSDNKINWYEYWGENVAVLTKDQEDKFPSKVGRWSLSEGGSGRRCGGQGDLLAGALATFYNWALKSNLCENENTMKIAQSVASYASAKLTRACNRHAFETYGRSMTTSDMINKIHSAFANTFGIN